MYNQSTINGALAEMGFAFDEPVEFELEPMCQPKTLLSQSTENEEVETNAQGGKQSYTPLRFDLIPPEAAAEMAFVLGQGAKKYGEENWRLIECKDHINHALQHLFNYLQNGNKEDLTHALCRVAFAVETHKEKDSE